MLQLICHPDTPPSTVIRIEIATKRFQDGRLWFRFCLEGQLKALELCAPSAASRTDGLWQSTCFEMFLRKNGTDSYLEYNFAPSSEWAAYAFETYRSGMAELPVNAPPEILIDSSDDHLALQTEIILPVDWWGGLIELNFTAVIEEIDGTKSYWALAHPPGKPDFHHNDCFALQLKAPSAP